tara:strand:- start:112 stop:561 length:450 start_codon:yes stop_codon:yes gene_type:complete
MKSLLVLGALLVSASPVIADDYLYFRCNQSGDLVITNSTTSKIIEDRYLEDIAYVKVDFKKKTVFDTRSAEPLSFTIQNNVITVLTKAEYNEVKINDVVKMNLLPPYPISSNGTIVFKNNNRTNTHRTIGTCEEIDASVFEKALKEAKS